VVSCGPAGEERTQSVMAEADRSIGSSTGMICILGHPVRHSRSPSMHNAAFATQGLDLVYLAFDVPPDDLAVAVAGLRALGVAGANITIPHKEAIIPLLDEVEPAARRTGAVNTLVSREGRLVGYNTDVYGFLRALEKGWGRGPYGARCLVVGAGGAARAVIAALVAEEAGEIWVYNRNIARARDLCAEVASWSPLPIRVLGESDLLLFGPQAELIVNATPAGMETGVKATPIPVDILTSDQVVLDVVYAAEATPLLVAAHGKGALVIDGVEMLVQQAARSYELWTGRAAPIDLMRVHALAS